MVLGFVLFFGELLFLSLLIVATLFSSSTAPQEFRSTLNRLVASTASSPSWENLLCSSRRPSGELPVLNPIICSFVLEFLPAVTHSLDLCIAEALE